VGLTQTLKDKVILDIADIDGTGIFATTLAESGREPKPIAEVVAPAVFIAPGGGAETDTETLTNRVGASQQDYVLQCFIQSGTPNADMDDLLDDLRNAFERATSNVLTASGTGWKVTDSTVSDWTEVLTDEDIHQQSYFREVTLTVAYTYTRGSA